jgi:xanthine dehydrogenase molybdopterin-binding subunit B
MCTQLCRAVRVSNDRTTEFVMVGGREGMLFDFEVGFQSDGETGRLLLSFLFFLIIASSKGGEGLGGGAS